MNERLTPVEEVLAETLNPDMIALEGLGIVLADPNNPESGWTREDIPDYGD